MKKYVIGIISGIIFGILVIAVVSILMDRNINKYSDQIISRYVNSDKSEINADEDSIIKGEIETDADVADTSLKNSSSLATASDASREGYFIKESDGYLVICYRDGTIYDYTNILIDTLDIATRKLVKEQVSFSSTEELYAFLESCTS